MKKMMFYTRRQTLYRSKHTFQHIDYIFEIIERINLLEEK